MLAADVGAVDGRSLETAGDTAAGGGEIGGAAAALAGGAVTTPSVIRVRMTAPSLTRSPFLTLSSATVPPNGDGTSIEALSDSSVINGCSALTGSPGFTETSMIGTSLKSPMSGTRTSATPLGALVGAGGGVTAGFACSALGAGPSSSNDKIGVPWLTLSPIFTARDLTMPAAGEGTSIDALSDSRGMSGASALIRSPTFTAISIIGTSLKSPMSGTVTFSLCPILGVSDYAQLSRSQSCDNVVPSSSRFPGWRTLHIETVFG